MNINIKLFLAIIYILCLGTLLFFVFKYLDVKELNNFLYIKENSKILLDYKNNNLFLFTIIFFIFSVFWILMLGFGSPIAIMTGFIFGQWVGTFLSVLAFTIGSSLLYLLANYYFSDFIIEKFSNKVEKYKKHFNKNEFFYFMIFRFTGGGGIPFAIQNVLPVIFNMKLKNYFYSTLIGLIPTLFIVNVLGAGIESIINNNEEINYLEIVLSPEIYKPMLGFLVILIVSFFARRIFFNK